MYCESMVLLALSDRQTDSAACMQERIEEAKRELEDAVERECTFAPVIDARSAGMMSHRTVVLKVGPASCCNAGDWDAPTCPSAARPTTSDAACSAGAWQLTLARLCWCLTAHAGRGC